MKKVLLDNQKTRVVVARNKVVVYDYYFGKQKSKKLRLKRGEKNVLLELAEVLKKHNKTFDDIIALRIDLNKCINRSTYLHGNVVYGEGEFDKIEDVIIDIAQWSYYNGYGSQELEGKVLFNDNSWIEREEYDGAEWWAHRRAPTIDEVLKREAI